MIDIKRIKENPDAIKAGMKAKEVDCDATIDRILELDVQVRGLKTHTETKTAEKNKLAKENGKLFGQKKGAEKKGEDTSALEAQINANMAASVKIDEEIAEDKQKLKELDDELTTCMLSLPNMPDPDLLPGGKVCVLLPGRTPAVDLSRLFDEHIRGIPLSGNHHDDLISLPGQPRDPTSRGAQARHSRKGRSSIFLHDEHIAPLPIHRMSGMGEV